MPKKIEISHKTIMFTVFFLLLLWFLYFIGDILTVFFVALLIMAILNPLVSKLSKYKIPRAVSVLVVYVIAVSVLSFGVAGVVPPLVEQTGKLVSNFPAYVNNLGISSNIGEQLVADLASAVGSISTQFVKIGVSLFSNILNILTVFIIAFYLLMAREKLDDQLENLFGEDKKKEIGKTIDDLEKRLGGWARGQLLLMLIVGSLTYLGLVLLGIPFALPLAIFAGILEMVPYIGPVISAIPALIIGFGLSSFMGIAVALLFFLIQQVENYLIVPKVMQKSVGINPVITLLALAIGFKIAGIVGILISLPVAITLQVITKHYLATK